jgi:hypothetical protein
VERDERFGRTRADLSFRHPAGTHPPRNEEQPRQSRPLLEELIPAAALPGAVSPRAGATGTPAQETQQPNSPSAAYHGRPPLAVDAVRCRGPRARRAAVAETRSRRAPARAAGAASFLHCPLLRAARLGFLGDSAVADDAAGLCHRVAGHLRPLP